MKRYTIWKYGKRWLVSYGDKPDYCVSDHASKSAAQAAVRRYKAADKRREEDDFYRRTDKVVTIASAKRGAR